MSSLLFFKYRIEFIQGIWRGIKRAVEAERESRGIEASHEHVGVGSGRGERGQGWEGARRQERNKSKCPFLKREKKTGRKE